MRETVIMGRITALGEFTRTWDPSLCEEFLRYDRRLREKSNRSPPSWGEKAPGPYWKELPRWLSARRGYRPRRPAPEFLEAVVWGQTCLFYAVRLQDDLLDGHLIRSPLALAPSLFLNEAHRTFSSVLGPDSLFWNHCRRALDTTVAGIVRVERLQRDPGANARDLLHAYGSVDAIFSVGAAAVCERMGMCDALPAVCAFVSEIGKVLLTLDDIEDLHEDLADRRLTLPAKMMLDHKHTRRADVFRRAERVRLNARSKGIEDVKGILLGCLERAREAVDQINLSPAMKLIESTEISVRALAKPA